RPGCSTVPRCARRGACAGPDAMNLSFYLEVYAKLLTGVPLMLQLVALSVSMGAILALLLALAVGSNIKPLVWSARAYIFVFRGTPLLVQLYCIYYGLAQF